jgi:hypothetical protein
MWKVLALVLIGSLTLTLFPSTALAGDPHAARDIWTGVAIGVGSVLVGIPLLSSLLGYPRPVYAAPPVVYSVPPVVYAPPAAVAYRVWVPGHYENHWVPSTERQQVWVEGHSRNGWWVPGHWEERVRNGGYWTRIWIGGYWR